MLFGGRLRRLDVGQPGTGGHLRIAKEDGLRLAAVDRRVADHHLKPDAVLERHETACDGQRLRRELELARPRARLEDRRVQQRLAVEVRRGEDPEDRARAGEGVAMDDQAYFLSLIRMYSQAIRFVSNLPPDVRIGYADRLDKLRSRGRHVGWGVEDELNSLWYDSDLSEDSIDS